MSRTIGTLPREETHAATSALSSWRTVVWNDAINLMDYVTEVLMRHFGYSRSKSEALMWQIHTQGRAIVATGMRERMEADVVAMHSYGLHATLERDE
ncbi:MAG: ATP-dependent Clp protease adapter ClpS [Actinomycetaceae bacterium]|nr:ATP-dependent Clp protease adapter ClpS [Actinomycetaceae bacterium]